MDDLKFVAPDEPWQETATFRNAVVEMLRRHFDAQRNFGDALPSLPTDKPRPILILNDANAPLNRYGVVGIADPMSPPDLVEDEWLDRVAFKSAPPAPDQPFAIILESMPKGEPVKAVMMGVIQCLVEFTDVLTHKYAAPEAENYKTLVAQAATGPAKILWANLPPATQLDGAIDAIITQLKIDDPEDYPDPNIEGEYVLTIGTEDMLVTDLTAGYLDVERHYNGTTAASHADDAVTTFKTGAVWAVVLLDMNNPDIIPQSADDSLLITWPGGKIVDFMVKKATTSFGLSGTLFLPTITEDQELHDSDNLLDYAVILLESDGVWDITSLPPGNFNGQILILRNVGQHNITLGRNAGSNITGSLDGAGVLAPGFSCPLQFNVSSGAPFAFANKWMPIANYEVGFTLIDGLVGPTLTIHSDDQTVSIENSSSPSTINLEGAAVIQIHGFPFQKIAPFIDPNTAGRMYLLASGDYATDALDHDFQTGSTFYVARRIGAPSPAGPYNVCVDAGTQAFVPLLSDPTNVLIYVDNIVTATALVNGSLTINSGSPPTDFENSLCVVITDANASITTGTVAIVGLDLDGNPVSESVALGNGAGSHTYYTSSSFADVTSITISGLAGAGAGDEIEVRIGSILYWYPQGVLRSSAGHIYVVSDANGAIASPPSSSWAQVDALTPRGGFDAAIAYDLGDYLQYLHKLYMFAGRSLNGDSFNDQTLGSLDGTVLVADNFGAHVFKAREATQGLSGIVNVTTYPIAQTLGSGPKKIMGHLTLAPDTDNAPIYLELIDINGIPGRVTSKVENSNFLGILEATTSVSAYGSVPGSSVSAYSWESAKLQWDGRPGWFVSPAFRLEGRQNAKDVTGAYLDYDPDDPTTWAATQNPYFSVVTVLADGTQAGIVTFRDGIYTSVFGMEFSGGLLTGVGVLDIPLADISGLDAGVTTWLATPSGANLDSALTTPIPTHSGGLGVDASGYNGLPMLTAGVTSNLTNTRASGPDLELKGGSSGAWFKVLAPDSF